MKKVLPYLAAALIWGFIVLILSGCGNYTPTCPTYVGGSRVKHGKKLYFSPIPERK